MTKAQIALVLAKAALYDARSQSEEEVEAWHECVGELNFDDAMKAVVEHYSLSTARLMPANLRPRLIEGENWD